MPTPHLGQTVRYLDAGLAGTDQRRNGGSPRAAIVTATQAEDPALAADHVHLHVFPPTTDDGYPAFDVGPDMWTAIEKG